MSGLARVADALLVATLVVDATALVLGLVRRRAAARLVLLVGVGVHAVAVVARGVAAGHLPWANMYEYSSALALVAVAVGLWATRGTALDDVRTATVAVAVATLGVGLLLAVPAGPLVPALATPWLAVHTSAAIVASGILTVGVAATGLYLWRGTDVLDALASRVVTLGFLVWTFAVLSGAVWAEQAWGRYWGWDPKETAAFVTWLLYAAYLHARATPRWRGRRAAWVGVAAYVALAVTYYVVNLVVVGLHSYA